MGRMWNEQGILKWYLLVTRKPIVTTYFKPFSYFNKKLLKDENYTDYDGYNWIFGDTDKPSWFNYNTLYGWYLSKDEYELDEELKDKIPNESFNNPFEKYDLS